MKSRWTYLQLYDLAYIANYRALAFALHLCFLRESANKVAIHSMRAVNSVEEFYGSADEHLSNRDMRMLRAAGFIDGIKALG